MEFYLSSKSLKQVKESGVEEDFKLRIFDNTINCSTFVALFISKQISQNYRNDPTIREFNFSFPTTSTFYNNRSELKNMIEHANFITKFNNFLTGSSIQIEEEKEGEIKDNDKSKNLETAKLIIEFGKVLKNEEMIEKGLNFLYLNDLSDEKSAINSIKVLQTLKDFDYPQNPEQIYDTISKNFCTLFKTKSDNEEKSIEIDKIKKMSRYDLEQIFSSPNLQIESEDWLFELINSLGPEFNYLYDYIEIQYLSVSNVELLIENIDKYEINLHNLLWSSICRRLLIDVSTVNKKQNPRQIKSQEIKCDDGIFKYLQKSSNDNVYVSKKIDVKVSGISGGEIKNIFDHSKDTVLRVKDNTNSFIIIDFKDKKVNLSKYYFSVPSQGTGTWSYRPKTWIIEGSNDSSDWTTIDERNNDSSLINYNASNTFDIKQNNNFYRYIRIKEIISQDNGHKILLSEIEFFGSIMNI